MEREGKQGKRVDGKVRGQQKGIEEEKMESGEKWGEVNN